jgi:hypothetical protein
LWLLARTFAISTVLRDDVFVQTGTQLRTKFNLGAAREMQSSRTRSVAQFRKQSVSRGLLTAHEPTGFDRSSGGTNDGI